MAAAADEHQMRISGVEGEADEPGLSELVRL